LNPDWVWLEVSAEWAVYSNYEIAYVLNDKETIAVRIAFETLQQVCGKGTVDLLMPYWECVNLELQVFNF
jgi:hypothetical protein